MAEERKKVGVACSIVNGVELRLHERIYDDDTASATGRKVAIPVGESVVLRGPSALAAGTGHPGDGAAVVTQVDAEWFARWEEQNKGSTLLESGAIKRV